MPPFRLYGVGKGITLPYLPRQLYKMLRDVLRNAARATLARDAVGAPLGEICVVISDADDNNDLVIKVTDEAGGIPRSKLKSIFSFSSATSPHQVAQGLADQTLCQALGPDSLGDGTPDILHTRGGHGIPSFLHFAGRTGRAPTGLSP